MRLRLTVCVLAAVATSALTGAPAPASTPSIVQIAHLHAKLRGSSTYPAIRGTADVYETPDKATINLTLWRANRLSGRRLWVYVGGQLIGAMRIDRGRAHLKGPLSEYLRGGHYRVTVRTRHGVLVASGRLRLVNAP